MLGSLLIGLVTLIASVLTYYVYQFWFSRAAKFMRKYPGPKKVFLLGNALDLNKPNEELTRNANFEYPRKYGPRYTISVGNRNYFTSSRAKDIEKLLSSSSHINKGIEYNFVMPWLGEGLLTSKGSKWLSHRKLLTPSFHFKILEEFMEVFNGQSALFVKILGKDSEGGKKALEISQYITLCTLDIICETAMGKSMNAQREKASPYVRAIYELSSLIQIRAFTPWYLYEFVWNLSPGGRKEKEYLKILHDFTENVIKERKGEILVSKKGTHQRKRSEEGENDIFMSKKKRAVAFMDLLLEIQAENPTAMTDKEVREETDTFMFEGHDTTAASLSFTIFLLGCYPDVQNKVFEELGGIFGDDRSRPVTSQDLTKIKYLECVIKESLRLYPSVPFMTRDLREDLILADGEIIPKGFNYSVFPLAIHRDPESWDNPEEFQPERFLPENSVGRHPFAYVPFSAGPRNCIGQKFALMEEKVILAHLLRQFRLESIGTKDDIVLTTELILRSKNGLPVRCFPR